MPALLLLTGPSAGARYEVEREAILGRSPSCEIPLEDGKVSRRHARLVVEDGQARITDLGSRNGTVVNGEKIEAEAILLPGDRFQIGETTALFEPPAKAALADRESGETISHQVEEVLPHVGPEASLFSAGVSLISSSSEAMVLRRGAEELARSVLAERAGALLGGTEGLLTAAVVGADCVQVPRAMARAALERRETSRADGIVCAPLTASGGSAFGVLYAERNEAFTAEEQRVVAALGRLVGEALATVRSRADREVPQVSLVGGSRQFRKVVEQARRAAAGSHHVVLHGEAGTGKALIAEYIHTRSARALGPMVVMDCRRPPAIIDEQLLGRPSSPGTPPLSSALLRADGGTLILTHLELLPRTASRALAGYLTRRAAPARAGGEERVDLRLIATCGLPLDLLSSRGEIDPELVKAMAATEIEVLPLRDRKPDVPGLFEHFATAEASLLRKSAPTLSPDAKRLLGDYAWPGNVRELRHVAERLASLYPGTEVPALRLPPEIQEGTLESKSKSLQDMINRLERDAIAEALREARGKKIRAAAILGISRPTLDKKIEDYGLVVEKLRRV
jgi:DNA-binding NtrC family response regulator/pSer/pThr/pTyr-binding forkhead associated (FHA) protein